MSGNMNGSVLRPDLRNLGGRTVVIQEKKAHTRLLANMRPQIDSRTPETMALSRNLSVNRASRQTSGAEMDVLREQRETYRRVLAVQAGTINRKGSDSNYPSTFFRAKAVSTNKKSRVNFEEQMHNKRIANMQRRIASIDTITEKKKNIYNPEVYPSLIMRREILDNTGVPFVQKKTPRQMDGSFSGSAYERPSSARSSTKTDPLNTSSRPQSARPSSTTRDSHDSAFDAMDDYERFRQNLLDTIINDRVYRAKDLRTLFDSRLEDAPSHLNRVKLERIVEGLRSVFLDPE